MSLEADYNIVTAPIELDLRSPSIRSVMKVRRPSHQVKMALVSQSGRRVFIEAWKETFLW